MRLDANSAGNSMGIKRFNNSRRARAVEAHALQIIKAQVGPDLIFNYTYAVFYTG